MRLSDSETDKIKTILTEVFGRSTIRVFGSRLDDNSRGGDIDLYIIPENRTNLLEKKLLALSRLERTLHKPVDLLIHRDFNRRIEQEAQSGIEL